MVTSQTYLSAEFFAAPEDHLVLVPRVVVLSWSITGSVGSNYGEMNFSRAAHTCMCAVSELELRVARRVARWLLERIGIL
jgi:hypothetical protein